MRDATFFPVIPHFLADKGIWIFAPNVAARADIAPSASTFFISILASIHQAHSPAVLKKAQKG